MEMEMRLQNQGQGLLCDRLAVHVHRLVLRVVGRAGEGVSRCVTRRDSETAGQRASKREIPNERQQRARSPRRTTYQLPELWSRPRIVLHQAPLHRLSEVLLEAIRERTLRLLELRRRERQPRVLVLAHVLQLLHVLAHLVEEVLGVLVVRVDATLELLLRKEAPLSMDGSERTFRGRSERWERWEEAGGRGDWLIGIIVTPLAKIGLLRR